MPSSNMIKIKDFKLSSGEYDTLEYVMNKNCRKVFEEYGVRTNVWRNASDMCAFFNLTKGKRYVGYYIDRMLMDFDFMAKSVGEENLLPDLFFQARKETFFEEYLGENVGVRKTDKKKTRMFKEEAILANIEPLQDRGIINFEKELFP